MAYQIPDRSTPQSSLAKSVLRIARSQSVEEIVARIRSSARFLIGCEGIAIIRREKDLCHYIDEDAIGALWKGQTFPASACISGWSMLNKQTVVVPDIRQDGRIPYELYGDTFVRALAMAPIRVDEPFGAIGVYWSQPYEPSHWEIEILEALAEAAAIALENIGFVVQEEHDQVAPPQDFSRDINRIAGISAVPLILDIVLQMTGMGFAAVARVTEDRWVACSALDRVGFGLKQGDELPIESTICNEIRDHRQAVVFEDAPSDPVYCDHHTPRMYGLSSYLSVPIVLSDGSFWGTLCAIHTQPAKVNNRTVIGTFRLFAELIGHHLDTEEQLRSAHSSLEHERELAVLQEQFIAVLGHDLRNPIGAMSAGIDRLLKAGWTEQSPQLVGLMKLSVTRMSSLVDNILDLARSQLGSGMVLATQETDPLATLLYAVDELKEAYPGRQISTSFAQGPKVMIDPMRIAQLLSNLLANALTHGAHDMPVTVVSHYVSGFFELSVINHGQAIPKDHIAKLFQPFQRGEAKHNANGLGLGLYIVAEIAKAHGGVVRVTSNNDETRFTFQMPTLPEV